MADQEQIEIDRAYFCDKRVELEAQVARLEGELALASAGLTAWKVLHDEAQERIAALEAVLEEEWTYSHNTICRKRTEGHRDCLRPKPAALSSKGQGWLEVAEQDVEAAIYFVEQARTTHVEWAAHLSSGGEAPEEVGSLERHQEYVQEYEHVLAVLRAALTDGGKGWLSPAPRRRPAEARPPRYERRKNTLS